MNKERLELWEDHTCRLNYNKEIKRGNRVIDLYGNTGIVVAIVIPDIDNIDGQIEVWNEFLRGGKIEEPLNCINYPYSGWQYNLRIVED